ncbi:MAG TPA: hypothetical protein VJA26_09005 [Gammaproteobacteria bacterium]|nr:hypothetical protein [Gammaproteobacteria bacterium]
MKLLPLLAMAVIAVTTVQAQTEQDMQRFERHVETHDLTPQGNCVVSFTLTSAGYIAAMNLSKCAAKDQASALTRLAAALPFPTSATVSREITLRL